ncbi:FecR family protein [Sphingomonas sp. Tas61C01]|uniref:FecR family protein n=1 Tax=Sphingomonas sp. Tas61C01 TaxID=3458297 RepID=UPI00403E7910
MSDDDDSRGRADRDEAVDWVVRMAEPDADWDAFTAWLEADPARAERYDRAATALADAATIVSAAPVAPVSVVAPRPRRWIAGALAAALVGAVGMGVWTQAPRPYTVETAAGEQRTVTLGDGSSVLIAGASRVRLDRHDPRVAAVERGEMLFRVRHDAARPFTVEVGDLRLVDLGTVFDVKSVGGRTRVAVAEGAVMVDPDGAAMRLDAGRAMLADGATIQRLAVDPAEVGGWRDGRLAFDGAPLSEVAADLSRQLGRQVVAAPAVAARPFRGTIDTRSIGGDPRLLGRLLGVEVRPAAGGWVLEASR